MKHKRIPTIDKWWAIRAALEIIYFLFYLQGTDSYLALLPQTFGYPFALRRRNWLGNSQDKVWNSFLLPQFSPRNPGADIFGVKKVLFLPHSHQAIIWVLLWRSDVLRVSVSPLFPHTPGCLYGSVPCILLLEKGVKYKGHYYCSFKVSDNLLSETMYYGPVLGTWKWITLCLCPWGTQPVTGTHL